MEVKIEIKIKYETVFKTKAKVFLINMSLLQVSITFHFYLQLKELY